MPGVWLQTRKYKAPPPLYVHVTPPRSGWGQEALPGTPSPLTPGAVLGAEVFCWTPRAPPSQLWAPGH